MGVPKLEASIKYSGDRRFDEVIQGARPHQVVSSKDTAIDGTLLMETKYPNILF